MKPLIKNKQHKSKKKIYHDKNIQIVFSITLMSILGVASITPTLPRIVQELNVAPQSVGLLITLFTLPIVILSPFIGVIADRFGRKKVLVPALLLFACAGVICAFTNNFKLLLILRFFQGIGAAPLGSVNITIISDIYSGKERTAAMGYNASVIGVSAAACPVIGGALAIIGWNYPFILPLLAIPVALLVLFVLKNPEPKNNQGFQEYLTNTWKTIRNRNVISVLIASLSTFILVFGCHLTYLPIFIGRYSHVSTFTIGLIMSSMSIAIIFSSSQLEILSKKFSTATLIKGSFLLYALSLIIIPFTKSLWMLLIPTTIFGIGHGIGLPCIQSLMARFADKNCLAIFMSVNGMVIALGQALGPMLMGTVFSIGGLNSVFYFGSCFSMLTILVFSCLFLDKKHNF